VSLIEAFSQLHQYKIFKMLISFHLVVSEV
jgi:hypothetical protein